MISYCGIITNKGSLCRKGYYMLIKVINSLLKKEINGYEVTPSPSPYFNNIKCVKCGHIERVPFNVVGYKCDKCKNVIDIKND